MTSIREELQAVLPERVDYSQAMPQLNSSRPIAVTSDLHLPYIDEVLFEEFIEAIDRHSVADVLIVGDFTHQDAFSRWGEGYNSGLITVDEEWAAGRKVLDILFRHVENVTILSGNHDARLLAFTKRNLTIADLYAMIYPRAAPFYGSVGPFTGDDGLYRSLTVYDFPSLNATIQGEKWKFFHPDEYSRIRGRVATNFAKVHHANIGVGHVHSFSMGMDESGKYMALELGGLFNPNYFDYLFEKPRSAPRMTTGFFIFDSGTVIPYPGKARDD